MLNIILAILVLAFLIFFHELGHFTVGKLLGFRVLGFSMGFGPALVTFKKGDTEYALRAIPFGGSCQLDGEDEDAETDPKRFNAQPVWKRFLVILAGPFMNVLLAFLISFILMLAVPVPIYAVDAGSGDNIPYIVDVVEGSAAEKAGILPGDIVIAVDGKNTMDAGDLLAVGLQMSFLSEVEDVMRNVLFLDQFTISRGSGSAFDRHTEENDTNQYDFNVRMGKYISDKVMIKYTRSLGAANVNRYGVQYDVNDRLGLTLEREGGSYIVGLEARTSF